VQHILKYRDGRTEEHLRRSWVAAPLVRTFDAVVVPSAYLMDVFSRHALAARAIFNIVKRERSTLTTSRP